MPLGEGWSVSSRVLSVHVRRDVADCAAGAGEVRREGCGSAGRSAGLAGGAACHSNLVYHIDTLSMSGFLRYVRYKAANEALQSQVKELQTQAFVVYCLIVV